MTVWDVIGASRVVNRIPEWSFTFSLVTLFFPHRDQVQKSTSWHIRCCEDFLNLRWEAVYGFLGLFFLFSLSFSVFYSRWVYALLMNPWLTALLASGPLWLLSLILWNSKGDGRGQCREGKEMGIFQPEKECFLVFFRLKRFGHFSFFTRGERQPPKMFLEEK